MTTNTIAQGLVRPERLVEGAFYLLVEKTGKCACDEFAQIREVRFVGFTTCPAVVLVLEDPDQRLRCLRERLFVKSTHWEVLDR